MGPILIHVFPCLYRARVPIIFEPAHTFGILALDGGFSSNMAAIRSRVNHKMAAIRSIANHKTSQHEFFKQSFLSRSSVERDVF